MSMTDKIESIAVFLVGARTVGHGRRMERFCFYAMGYYTIIMFVVPFVAPFAMEKSSAISELFWKGYSPYIRWIALVDFVVAGLGFRFNVRGIRGSQQLRFVGGLLGLLIWGWFGTELFLIGNLTAPGAVLCQLVALYGCGGVMLYAAANRPRPGAPGAMGDRVDGR